MFWCERLVGSRCSSALCYPRLPWWGTRKLRNWPTCRVDSRSAVLDVCRSAHQQRSGESRSEPDRRCRTSRSVQSDPFSQNWTGAAGPAAELRLQNVRNVSLLWECYCYCWATVLTIWTQEIYTHTHRETHTQRNTHTHTEKHKHTHNQLTGLYVCTHRNTHTEKQTHTQRNTHTHTHRGTHTHRETHTHRNTHTEKHTHTQKHTHARSQQAVRDDSGSSSSRRCRGTDGELISAAESQIVWQRVREASLSIPLSRRWPLTLQQRDEAKKNGGSQRGRIG